MHQAAYWSLLVALFVSVIMPAFCALHLWRGEEGMPRLIERGHLAAVALMTVSAVILTIALVRRDFSFMYVYEYTDAALPLFYALTAFWAGQAGSLLLWVWLMGVLAALFASGKAYAALSPQTKLTFWLFFLAIQAFFLLLLTGPSTPLRSLARPSALCPMLSQSIMKSLFPAINSRGKGSRVALAPRPQTPQGWPLRKM